MSPAKPKPAPLPAGTVVGGYTVVKKLAAGGFGVVYLARDRTLERLLVVKVLHPSTVVEPGVRDRLQTEARTAAMVQHRNVVVVFEVDVRGDPPYIAMEFVPGLTLAERIRDGRLSVPTLTMRKPFRVRPSASALALRMICAW